MQKAMKEGDRCPKCATLLRTVLCTRCYGTGKSGSRNCKNCGGSGISMGCPNFRSHRIWPWLRKGHVPPAA